MFTSSQSSRRSRNGTVLILMVMLLLALLAIASLVIDVALSRLSQSQMQSISDAASLEGAWIVANQAENSEPNLPARNAAVSRADDLVGGFPESASTSVSSLVGWGPGRVEFLQTPGEAGFDLDNDGIFESAQTIDRGSLGQATASMLNPNPTNGEAGDVVIGRYEVDQVPQSLPGKPSGYDRAPAFQPDASAGSSLLVRLRRTGEIPSGGGTANEQVSYLWGRGSLLNFGAKGRGIAVRSESIANLFPAVAVGQLSQESDDLPIALRAGVKVTDALTDSIDGVQLMSLVNGNSIGERVSDPSAEPQLSSQTGYLAVVDEIPAASDEWFVIGFLLAEVIPQNNGFSVRRVTIEESSFLTASVTANLAHGWNSLTQQSPEVVAEVVRRNHALDTTRFAAAPLLVRSQQIQESVP